MFKINKLNSYILEKMDKELIMLEIKNLTTEKHHLDKLSLSFISIIFGGLLSKIFSSCTNNQSINTFYIFLFACCLVYFLFITVYNHIQTKQFMEYEQELYNLAANKSQEEKENKTK